MGQQYVPGRLIYLHVLYCRTNGIGIAFDALIGVKTLYMDGLYKRQQPKIHRAIFIRERNRFYLPTVYGGDMDAAVL